MQFAARGPVVFIPMKRLDSAKSRLCGAGGLPDADVAALAMAFAIDVATAVAAADTVRHTVAVTSDAALNARLRELGIEVFPDLPEAGINPAIAAADGRVGAAVPRAVVAADLPCVRPVDVAGLLGELGSGSRGVFIADQGGTGTCAVAVPAGARLVTAFGARSRAAHRRMGYRELVGQTWTRVRRDVDTPVDLWDAVRLGVGSATSSALAGYSAG